MTWCPFCEESSAKLKTHKNGTHYLHCEKCGEDFIPSAMMDDNISMLKTLWNSDTKESTLSYEKFVHPDMEAIKRRDEFLSNDSIHIIEMNENRIVAEIEDIKMFPY